MIFKTFQHSYWFTICGSFIVILFSKFHELSGSLAQAPWYPILWPLRNVINRRQPRSCKFQSFTIVELGTDHDLFWTIIAHLHNNCPALRRVDSSYLLRLLRGAGAATHIDQSETMFYIPLYFKCVVNDAKYFCSTGLTNSWNGWGWEKCRQTMFLWYSSSPEEAKEWNASQKLFSELLSSTYSSSNSLHVFQR